MKVISVKKSDKVTFNKLMRLYNEIFYQSRWSGKCFSKFLKEKGICILAKEKIKIAGFALGIERNKKSIELHALGVAEDFRSKRIGRKLLRFFMKEARKRIKQGCVIIHFRDSKKRLLNFYSSEGAQGDKITGEYRNGDLKHQIKIKI